MTRKENLLFVVDYQNDFVIGALGFEKAKALEEKIYIKVKQHVENGGLVVFTKDTHSKNYLETIEGKHLPVPHCIYETEGHELYGKLNELFEEKKESKRVISMMKRSFGLAIPDGLSCGLSDTVKSVEICGIVTNMCVLSVAVTLQAHIWNTPITIDASCCASFDDELHEKALDIMESLQMNVVNR